MNFLEITFCNVKDLKNIAWKRSHDTHLANAGSHISSVLVA